MKEKNDQVVIIRLSKSQKKEWRAKAERLGCSLTDLIKFKVNER
jgi:ribosomal 50S subunit-associated protein YjgA (DUF615 family)